MLFSLVDDFYHFMYLGTYVALRIIQIYFLLLLGLVYVASTQHIWCLKMVPVSKQIPKLLEEKQFELALTLTNVCENKLDDKVKRMQEIQILYGFDLFCNMKFKGIKI